MYFVNSRLLLSICSLFMLSEAATVKRLCYWCGPLAEQVHRSPRAPPCDASTEPIITGCESEFPYCAVVATSPPYVESRLCVKLYQDECYPLFCNSTRTWKMTCPCRNDLCNGANTERENEAFAILDKLVAKTKTSRIKRTGINAVQFVPSGSEKTHIVNNISVSNIPNHMNEDNKNEGHKTEIMIANELTPDNDEVKNIDLDDLTTIEPTDEIQSTNTEIKIENAVTGQPKMELLPDELISDEIIKVAINPTSMEASDEYIPTASEDKDDNMLNRLQPSEELPTAEALQQNTTPKSNEITTLSSVEEMTDITTDEVEVTTEINSNKNTASTVYKNFITYLNISILQYYLSYLH